MPTSKQRRDAERRRLQRQLARRQQRAATRKRNTLILSVIGTLVVIAVVLFFIVQVGSDDKTPTKPAAHRHRPTPTATTSAPTPTPSPSPSPSPSTSAARTPTYPCDWKSSGLTPAKQVDPPSTTKPRKKGKVTVSVHTTRGAMTFTLNRAAAPCTVASFVSLVKQKYFDATKCHRLTTAGIFVLQCGDPTGSGTGGPGYSIPDEATGKETYPAGTIAMARSQGPHTGGSQFFIVYKNSPNLMQHLGQLQYTVFGRVSAGLGVVKAVAAKGAATGTDGAPKLPITIDSMRAA
jgi:peptidyl-prolyl cis-trans isomerase B (cyclophilin B)